MNQIRVDENWITGIAKGDGDAFRRLYEATDRTVYGYALSLLSDRQDAHDVMHDTYIRVYENAASYRREGRPLAWILTIVRNLAYDRLRNLGRTRPEPAEASVWQRQDPFDGMKQTEDRIVLETALQVLNETEREVVVLHAVTGLKHREIAELLEQPLSTILSRYQRSMQKLRTALEETGVRYDES